MKKLLIIFFFIGLAFSCEKTSIQGVDIIGEWYVIDMDCDTCMIYNFQDENNILVRIVESDRSFEISYKLYFTKIEIEYLDTKEKYDVHVYDKNEIEIIGFTTSNIPEVYNTRLRRVND